MRMLVVATAPVAGEVKTRLAAAIGARAAAVIAAAALLDSLAVCAATVGPQNCHLALAGDLANAVQGAEIAAALTGWSVTPQRGADFAARLVNAHHDAGDGLVVQIGMDTPHATTGQLRAVAHALHDHDVALGPAQDGGWWVLARRDPEAVRPLLAVQMSTSNTFRDSWVALWAAGLTVETTTTLRDVDTVEDGDVVAGEAPTTRFAAAWSNVARAS
jgi:glycosyltransferase A (GT-A) superfamily protein (DUF2064 family)